MTKKRPEISETPGEDVNVQELVVLLQQIDAGYKKLLAHFKDTLKNLRSELIKSRSEVFKMMKGADVEIPEESEP